MHTSENLNNNGKSIDLIVFTIIISFFSLPLLKGQYFESMIFMQSKFETGEYWRVLTHPFVHLSWYHLLLDAGAFLLLYHGLKESSRMKRIVYVVASGAGSLVFSFFTSTIVSNIGYCGLSGIAHGIMAVSALESMQRDNSTCWKILFLVVVGKSIIEGLSGHVVFEFLHFGLMGVPVATAHAGGVLAGITTFIVMNFISNNNSFSFAYTMK